MAGRKIIILITILLISTTFSGCISEEEELPEKVEFYVETSDHGNRLVHEFVPKTNKTSNYTISYNISKNQETLKSNQEQEYTEINKENPISITINDLSLTEYGVQSKIIDEYGRTVYKGEIVISRSNLNNYSFEEGMQGWKVKGTDLDNPPVEWSIERSNRIATKGNTSIKYYLENVNDAGKIWIEKPYIVEPNKNYKVNIEYDFASMDWGDVNLWRIITGIVPKSTENKENLVFQGDTGIGEKTNEFKWNKKSYEFTVNSGENGKIYAMIGVWGTWETTRIYYVDNVKIEYSELN